MFTEYFPNVERYIIDEDYENAYYELGMFLNNNIDSINNILIMHEDSQIELVFNSINFAFAEEFQERFILSESQWDFLLSIFE